MSQEKWSVRPLVMLGLFSVVILFGGFMAWATFAQLSGAVIAPGRVEVDRNRQVVQHPYGGVVDAILVDEGETVTEGQLLIQLDADELRSELAVIEGQLFELIARRNRLEAERDNTDDVTFDAFLTDEGGESAVALMNGQASLFDARRASADTQIEQYRRRMEQTQEQIKGIEAQQASLLTQLELIESELADQQQLLDRGLAQATRVLALQREQANLEGRQGELTAGIAQSEGRITEIELAILGIETTRREEAISQLRELQPVELELRERRRTLAARLDRLDIRAPVAGVVYGLAIYSEAAVIQPAEPLLYIVPQDRPLVISSRIFTRDIDLVRTDQEVTLRFSAFDQRQTPELYGHVVTISADAFEDEASRMSYYRIEIVLNDGEAERLPEGSVIVPGMPVEAFIRTGERSPMAFLTKPLTDFFTHSFRES